MYRETLKGKTPYIVNTNTYYKSYMPNFIFLETLVFKWHLTVIQQVFKRVEGKCVKGVKPSLRELG